MLPVRPRSPASAVTVSRTEPFASARRRARLRATRPAPMSPPASSHAAREGKPSRVYGLLAVSLLVTAATTSLLYTSTQRLFRWSLEEKLRSIATVAALQFSPAELDQILDSEDWRKPAYRQVVLALQDIRRHTSRVKYIYILRKTDDPGTMAFVADADSLTPETPIDLNGDGTIDDSDALTRPGEPYDVSAFPEFQQQGFRRPFVDPEPSRDQWGTFLSATAPIRDPDSPGEARYLLGVDVDVTDFLALTNLAVVPFVLFVVFILLMLTTLTVMLRRMWRFQVSLLREIDRQKDELLGIVSHQLQAPITAIRWSLELLLSGDLGPLPAEHRQHLQSAVASTRNLSELVDLLLDVSRIELGRLRMQKRPVALAPFFQSIIDAIEPQAREKGVSFRHALPPELPHGVLDDRLTRMTVENLLTNAVKYTPAGGTVTVTVTLHGQKLRCEVRDTGCGIPKADQSRLFTKLYRASNVGEVPGHGLGLYVAKGAIEQQGGRLAFESEAGSGTRFWFELDV